MAADGEAHTWRNRRMAALQTAKHCTSIYKSMGVAREGAAQREGGGTPVRAGRERRRGVGGRARETRRHSAGHFCLEKERG